MTRQLSIDEIAELLKWAPCTVRRWLWFLRVEPSGRRPKWTTSSRGRRKVMLNTYDATIVQRLREAR
jgi:hypothetical protein